MKCILIYNCFLLNWSLVFKSHVFLCGCKWLLTNGLCDCLWVRDRNFWKRFRYLCF